MRSAPLEGYLRVDQMLQLLPVPADAPRPPEGVRAYHACILEVGVETSTNEDITELRVHRAQMRTWQLLNALLRAHLTRFDRRDPSCNGPRIDAGLSARPTKGSPMRRGDFGPSRTTGKDTGTSVLRHGEAVFSIPATYSRFHEYREKSTT